MAQLIISLKAELRQDSFGLLCTNVITEQVFQEYILVRHLLIEETLFVFNVVLVIPPFTNRFFAGSAFQCSFFLPNQCFDFGGKWKLIQTCNGT